MRAFLVGEIGVTPLKIIACTDYSICAFVEHTGGRGLDGITVSELADAIVDHNCLICGTVSLLYLPKALFQLIWIVDRLRLTAKILTTVRSLLTIIRVDVTKHFKLASMVEGPPMYL